MRTAKTALMLTGSAVIGMSPVAALADDVLPLKHGFYVADVPCKDASYGTISSYAGGDTFAVGHASCKLKIMNKSGNTYKVASKCYSERDNSKFSITDVYTITSETSFTLKNKHGEFANKYCEQSSLPFPWGDK